MTARQCAACPAAIRRSTGLPLCPASNALAERAFRREHSPLDADRMPQRRLFFGDVPAVVAAVRGERRALAVAGA